MSGTLFDVINWYSLFLTRRVDKHKQLAVLARQKSADHKTIRSGQGCGAERLIKISIRIENVFHQTGGTSNAYAVKLRPHFIALASDLVTYCTVFYKHLLTARAIRRRLVKFC